MIDQLDGLKIRTNNQPRNVLRWDELTTKERAEFDYLDTEQRQEDAQFVRYRGCTYDLGEFMALRDTANGATHFKGWNGQHSDSYFSGVLLKYVGRDLDQVILATYTC